MSPTAGESLHFEGATGPLFGVLHLNRTQALRGQVLLTPPWGEELNTTRRLASQAASRMADAGWAVLRYDPWGCGDSGGDQPSFDWDAWQADARAAWQFLASRCEGRTTSLQPAHWVWGIRAGALLAADLVQSLQRQPVSGPVPHHMLWWQPVLHGRLMVKQWQRQARIQSWHKDSAESHAPTPSDDMLWVGGHCMPAEWLSALQRRSVPTPSQRSTALVWLDTGLQRAMPTPMSTDNPKSLTPAQTEIQTQWNAQQCTFRCENIVGPNYWMTLGEDDAAELLDRTLAHLESS